MFSNCLVYYFCVLFIQLVFNCVVASDKLDKASIVFPELNIPPKSNLKNDRTSDITDGIDELTRASNAFSLDYFHVSLKAFGHTFSFVINIRIFPENFENYNIQKQQQCCCFTVFTLVVVVLYYRRIIGSNI